MRVLFIQTNGFLESLGIAALAASVEKAGHKADLLLLSHCRSLFSDLKTYRPDLIAFSVLTGAHEEIMSLCRFLKANTDIPIIVGGPHPTFYTEETIAENCMDYICVGEGEIALVELLNRLSEGRRMQDIPNICINNSGEWIRNEIGPIVEDLDSIPFPKREIYYKYDFLRQITMKRFITGLGCPFFCGFCHNPILIRDYKGKGRYVRRKSVQRVIDEVLYVKKRAALKMLHFSDDLFTLNDKWLVEFSEKFPTLVGLPFSCNSRLDCSAKDIDLLAQAGCIGVTFGFESGSERVRRDYLKKLWTNEQAMEIVGRFKKHGIATMSNNMISLPGETLEDVFSTVEWNARIGFKFCRSGIFLPFPKLELTQIAKQKGLLEKDFSLKEFKISSANPMFNQEHRNELINVNNLFYLAIKLPFLRNFILRYIIRMKPNKFFDLIGWLSGNIQHYLFFHLRPVSTWKYFKNAIASSNDIQNNIYHREFQLKLIHDMRDVQKRRAKE